VRPDRPATWGRVTIRASMSPTTAMNRRTHLFTDLMEVAARGPDPHPRVCQPHQREAVRLLNRLLSYGGVRSRSQARAKPRLPRSARMGLNAPLMFVGQGMGQRLGLPTIEHAKAFHPSLLVLDGLKLFRDGPHIFEAMPVGYDITLPRRAAFTLRVCCLNSLL
jgi:hypothetical protein